MIKISALPFHLPSCRAGERGRRVCPAGVPAAPHSSPRPLSSLEAVLFHRPSCRVGERGRRACPAGVPAALAVFLLLPATLTLAQRVGDSLQNFKATLQRHPNGRVKTQLTAETATVPSEGTIHASGVCLFMLTPDGDIECTLESDEVEIVQETQYGHCPRHAAFERHTPHDREITDYREDGVFIEGDDVEWFGDRGKLVINTNAVIKIFRDGKSVAEGWK